MNYQMILTHFIHVLILWFW